MFHYCNIYLFNKLKSVLVFAQLIKKKAYIILLFQFLKSI